MTREFELRMRLQILGCHQSDAWDASDSKAYRTYSRAIELVQLELKEVLRKKGK